MPESRKCFTINGEGEVQGPVLLDYIKDNSSWVWGPYKNQWTLTDVLFANVSKVSNSNLWYWLDADDNPQGPLGVRSLCDLYVAKEINDATYLWSKDEGQEAWTKLRDISSLALAIDPLRLKNPRESDFDGQMPETPNEGFLGYLQLLAELGIDGNIVLQEQELVTLFGTKRSAEYMVRTYLQSERGMETMEALNTIKEDRAFVTVHDCRFMFRNLQVSDASLRRLITPPMVSFPKVIAAEPIIVQAEEKQVLLPNIEKIGVVHALFDFADAEGTRRFHKRKRYQCYFYSQVCLFLGTIFVLLGTRQKFDKDDRQIISFVAGLLMIFSLGTHWMGQKSAREYSERTNRVNQYLDMYGVSDVKPHVLLAQLSEHVETLSSADRATLQALAERAGQA